MKCLVCRMETRYKIETVCGVCLKELGADEVKAILDHEKTKKEQSKQKDQ